MYSVQFVFTHITMILPQSMFRRIVSSIVTELLTGYSFGVICLSSSSDNSLDAEASVNISILQKTMPKEVFNKDLVLPLFSGTRSREQTCPLALEL